MHNSFKIPGCKPVCVLHLHTTLIKFAKKICLCHLQKKYQSVPGNQVPGTKTSGTKIVSVAPPPPPPTLYLPPPRPPIFYFSFFLRRTKSMVGLCRRRIVHFPCRRTTVLPAAFPHPERDMNPCQFLQPQS